MLGCSSMVLRVFSVHRNDSEAFIGGLLLMEPATGTLPELAGSEVLSAAGSSFLAPEEDKRAFHFDLVDAAALALSGSTAFSCAPGANVTVEPTFARRRAFFIKR